MKTWLLVTLMLAAGVFFEQYKPPHQSIVGTLEIPEQVQKHPPAFSRAEVGCIARVIYHESRNQPRLGQIAVGAVLVNRTLASFKGAPNVCSVARQPHQFAYGNIPAPRAYLDKMAWVEAQNVAEYVTSHYLQLDDSLKSYKYFNSNKAKPGATTIEDHHFYV